MRKIIASLLGIALLAVIATPASATPPSNDNRADALLVSTFPFTTQIDTTDATTEDRERLDECGRKGATVWFRVPAGAPIRISTEGSDFDTMVTVFGPDYWDNCADDNGEGDDAVLTVYSDEDLFIQVGGWTGDTGMLQITIERANGAISGRVTDDAGRPLRAICVETSGDGWWNYATTRSDGTYAISRIFPGTHTVLFSDCAVGEYASRYYGTETEADAPVLVTVRPGETTTGIDIALSLLPAPVAPGAIAGTITDDAGDPVSSACATLFSEGWAVNQDGVDETGGFAFRNLAPGPYLLRYDDHCSWDSAEDADTQTDAPYFRAQWSGGAATLAEAVPVTVAADATTTVEVTLERIPLPDLAVGSIVIRTPDEPNAELNGAREIDVTIRNDGPGSFTNDVTMEVIVCPDGIGYCDYFYGQVGPLAPDESTVLTFAWDASRTVGAVRLDAHLWDPPFDTDETNNFAEASGHVRADVPVGTSVSRCALYPVCL